jgi:hypothetical protein
MTWNEIKNGYGLQAVPSEHRRELCCICCAPHDNGRGKLWTTEPITYDGTLKGLNRMLDRLRQNCYCRFHAEAMYKDTGTEG